MFHEIGDFKTSKKKNGCMETSLNILTAKSFDLADRPIFVEEIQPLLLQSLNIFAKNIDLGKLYSLCNKDFYSLLVETENHVDACFLSSEFCIVFRADTGKILSFDSGDTSQFLSRRKIHVFAKSNLEGELLLCSTPREQLLNRLNNLFQVEL